MVTSWAWVFWFLKQFQSIILKHIKHIGKYPKTCTQYKFASFNTITECAR